MQTIYPNKFIISTFLCLTYMNVCSVSDYAETCTEDIKRTIYVAQMQKSSELKSQDALLLCISSALSLY